MSRTEDILVIGAAHLDIVGDYGAHVADSLDKPGDLVYSVGGTAYNISSNLAQNNTPVSFLTALKEDSLITPIILRRLTSYGINTDLVEISDSIDESGFIALREDGVLVSAVTATTMDKFVFSEILYGDALKKCRFVVMDCNLSSSAINLIQNIAGNYGKKIIVAGVSESKVKRIMQIDRRESVPYPFFIVSMNFMEAKALGIDLSRKIAAKRVVDFCDRIGSENIIVSAGKDGHHILKRSGAVESFAAPNVASIVSITGCGDALTSAVCHHYYHTRDINWEECNRVIGRFVSQVIGRKGATVGARTAPKELKVVPMDVFEKEQSLYQEKVISVLGSRTVNLFGARVPLSEVFAFIAFLVAIGATLLPVLPELGLSLSPDG